MAKSGQKAAFYDPAPTPTPHTIPTPYSKKPSQTPNDRLLHTNIIRNLWLLKDWYDRVSPADIIISPVSHHQLISVLYQISGISVPSNLGLCVQWSWKNRTNLIVLPQKFIFVKRHLHFQLTNMWTLSCCEICKIMPGQAPQRVSGLDIWLSLWVIYPFTSRNIIPYIIYTYHIMYMHLKHETQKNNYKYIRLQARKSWSWSPPLVFSQSIEISHNWGPPDQIRQSLIWFLDSCEMYLVRVGGLDGGEPKIWILLWWARSCQSWNFSRTKRPHSFNKICAKQ